MTRVVSVQQDLGGTTVRGTLYTPDGDAQAHPTVVLHHGFNSNRLEAFGLFVQLSRLLAGRGIQTVAFDRLGQGESDGSLFEMTIEREIATSAALLDEIAEWPTVDGDNLHLAGMSLGAVVASTLTAETAHRIASLTLFSPAAVFVDDARAGLMQGRVVDDEIRENGFFDLGGARLGPEFFEVARDFDVYGRAAGYRGPVRIIHGGSDEVVPTEYVLRYREVYGEHADITVVPDADHVWSSVPTRGVLLGEAVAFLQRQVELARAR